MAKVRLVVDAKAIRRHSDFVFDPGDQEVSVTGDEVRRAWTDGVDEDPGLTVWQAEIIRDLVEEGVSIDIDEDGNLSLVER
jgi:hypothetical protein